MGLTRRRSFLFIVFLGVCLCLFPWVLDWAMTANHFDIKNILRTLPEGWINRGYFATMVGDKRGSFVSNYTGVPGDTSRFQSNMTRRHTMPVSRSFPTISVTNIEEKIKIIIGLGITSFGLKDITPSNLRSKFPFFRHLLPTFCKTASGGYHYGFYLGYDYNDTFFSQESHAKGFERTFQEVVQQICAEDLFIKLHLVRCDHAGRPAWAQNDAMMEGYLDGGEYFYRVNDDTKMETPGWMQDYLNILQHYNPPNVGVVGPRHVGGNQALLTYDFVHRTHVDIFGFYYPRMFRDWFADDWITKVYEPGRTARANKVWLKHTQEFGQRYRGTALLGAKLKDQVANDHRILNRYILARESLPWSTLEGRREEKVLSMALHGSEQKSTYGALHNAQLLPVFFPGWTLRIYVCDKCESRLRVPARILRNLERLGAGITYVSEEHSRHIPPRYWSFLVADDLEVDYFLLREPEHRLCSRDSAVVHAWLQTDKAVVCMRDHPDHTTQPVVDGLWGGRPAMLKPFLESPVATTLMKNVLNDGLLLNSLWKVLGPHSICYDSVSCNKWPSTAPFPDITTKENRYMGQEFDEFNNPVRANEKVPYLWQCVKSANTTSVPGRD